MEQNAVALYNDYCFHHYFLLLQSIGPQGFPKKKLLETHFQVGNHRIILEYTPEEISDSGRYKVRLHESQWRSRLSPDVPVTRKQLMVALQNLQGIYIRATYNYPARSFLSGISPEIGSFVFHLLSVVFPLLGTAFGFVGDGGAVICGVFFVL